jgi:hypothetical protein
MKEWGLFVSWWGRRGFASPWLSFLLARVSRGRPEGAASVVWAVTAARAVTVGLQVMAGPVELLVWAVMVGAAASLHWAAVTECATP